MSKTKVGFEEIEDFLEGRDPQKYIVGIESSYRDDFVHLVINDPVKGKTLERHPFKPFLWMKELPNNLLYEGNKTKLRLAMTKYNVKFKLQRISNDEGFVPTRLDTGYKYLVTSKQNYGNLINFFREGGLDIFSKDLIDKNNEDSPSIKSLFVAFAPAEQFLIQTGKRLFKGMDDYNDVHRLQFDLETEGLVSSIHAIFQIGIRDNRGFETILESKSEHETKLRNEGIISHEDGDKFLDKLPQSDSGKILKERRESERQNIIKFFEIIEDIMPDVITDYNGANFDWPFIKRRCERLNLDITKAAKTLHPEKKIRWKEATLKLGGESQEYDQTYMWGYNLLDISHSVRRAQAINSNIKKWGLKYITEFSGVAKKNRVYVPGDSLYKTWSDTRDYWFNDEDGSYGLDGVDMPESGILKSVKGDYIVQRYLLDDLWETEQVDGIYNQASYLIAKLLPTSYMRSSTMGTAGQWKLIMAAWSYEKGLGIPSLTKKRPFVGGLSRLVEVGYARNVIKLDFAALYPKIQLTHLIFPDLDISGVMEGLLTYIVDKRDEFKFLTGEHKEKSKDLANLLDKNKDKLTEDRIIKGKAMITHEKKIASDYDKKQLPLKILANSFFGAYGAPYIFNWGDTDCAEETTCRGRQYLRLMVKHFFEGHNFRPLVGDTDGFNFAIPDTVNDVSYICKASHWKTKHYTEGQELIGLEAVLAEFNEVYMIGRMGLDIDDICRSTINFARKNYANDIDGKVKLVGNSLKSKGMSVYIEEFINKGVRMLLDGDGYNFIKYYQDYVEDIYNYKIPVAKIASKSRVKITPEHYKNVYLKQKNKAGRGKSRQAHMELILRHDLKVDLGDTIYYVNTGTAKSHSDIKAIKDKETSKVIEVLFNCKLIPQSELDKNPDYVTDEYNVAKYLEAFNKRIKPLLVCFEPEVRDKVILNLYKDKKTKVVKLQEKNVFTEKECDLIAGKPFEESDQDSYEDLMTMADSEIRFWDDVDMLPNNMEQDEWDGIRLDYLERKELERLEAIKVEKYTIRRVFSSLDYLIFRDILEIGFLPKEVLNISNLVEDENGKFIFKSTALNEELMEFDDIYKYQEEARVRHIYYNNIRAVDNDDRYDLWLDYISDVGVDSLVDLDTKLILIENKINNDMEKLVLENGWNSYYDGRWIPIGADYNLTGDFTLEQAYNSVKSHLDEIEKARNQTKEDTIMKLDDDLDVES